MVHASAKSLGKRVNLREGREEDGEGLVDPLFFKGSNQKSGHTFSLVVTCVAFHNLCAWIQATNHLDHITRPLELVSDPHNEDLNPQW